MSKIIYVLSQIPELAKLTAKALPGCRIINIELRQQMEAFQRGLKIDDRELNDLKDAEIIFGDANLLAQTFHKLPKIQWMQGTWAGIDSILNVLSETGQKPPDCKITRFSGDSFGQLIFDYCIGHIVMMERKSFDNYVDTKFNKIWRKDTLQDCRTVNEITIGILGGTGAIGSFVAKKFSLLGSRVIGYGRTYNRNKVEGLTLEKYSTKLEDILPECDYIISVLPSTPETKGLLNNGVLQLCKEKCPVLINVGRGSLISENEIVNALNNKWIAAAVLDVFETEPLPESSILWSHQNVFITPHNAAESRAKDCVKLFVENYAKFLDKEPLSYLIDWESGY